MRITNSSIVRNYMTNLNKSLSNLNRSQEKMGSLSKYNRASENTSAAARAYVIREQIYKDEQYLSNIGDAEGELTSAESNLMTVNSLLKTATERVERGMTGTMEDTDRAIFAEEIKNLKNQILQAMNAKFGSRFTFGNSNNAEAPFSVGADGKMTYNGVSIESMSRDPATGDLMYPNAAYDPLDPDSSEFLKVPKNKEVYMDSGLGLKVTGSSVDPKSAIKISTSGIEALGIGEDNIFNLLNKIELEFKNNNVSDMSNNLASLEAGKAKLMLHVTDIGSRSSYLEQTSARIENEKLDLQKKQKDLEGINVEHEAILNKSFEVTWMINLQLGSQIIPPSIFDFMR